MCILAVNYLQLMEKGNFKYILKKKANHKSTGLVKVVLLVVVVVVVVEVQ